MTLHRSSHRRCSIKHCSQKYHDFTGTHLCWVSFFNNHLFWKTCFERLLLVTCRTWRGSYAFSVYFLCPLVSNFRGGFRTAAISKMELFVIIVNGFQPLTIIRKCSVLSVAAVLDLPLRCCNIITTSKKLKNEKVLRMLKDKVFVCTLSSIVYQPLYCFRK